MNRREFVVAAAGLVAAPNAFARGVGGGRSVALVTADLESRIVPVDLDAGLPMPPIKTLADPRSIETVGGTAVVAHTAQPAVSIVDVASLEVRSALRAFDEPRYTAAAPDGRHAFVTDSGSQSIVVVDVLRGRVVRRLAVGGPARHISVDRRGRLWTALGTRASRIAVIDVRDPVWPRAAGTDKGAVLRPRRRLRPVRSRVGHFRRPAGDRALRSEMRATDPAPQRRGSAAARRVRPTIRLRHERRRRDSAHP